MQAIISSLLVFPFLILCLFSSQEFELIDHEYLSPEHLYLDRSSNQVFIGLSSYPGIAVYNIQSKAISKIIPMPSPVKGVLVDEKENILYAAAGKHKACLYAYDLTSSTLQTNIPTGFGPTEIAISRNSSQLFVVNSFSHDVSVIEVNSQTEIKRIPADREPVAIAVSPSEDLIAVANLLPAQASTSNYVSAKVTIIDSRKLEVIKNLELPNGAYGLKDILFSKDGNFIYVSHLIGRYNVLTNQIEKGWINTNALSIIDVVRREIYTTVLLDDIHKGAANPGGLNLSEDGKKLFVAISGTDELFVIDRIAMHKKIEQSQVDITTSQSTELISDSDKKIKLFEHPDKYKPMGVQFDDIPKELSFLASVRKRIHLQGKGPAQLVCDEKNIYATSFFSDGLEIVNLNNEQPEEIVKIGSKDIAGSKERYGELLFHSAEKCFQQWQSCASCHPGEGRVDGLNWDLLNDGIGNPKNTKSLLLSHVTPPAMATGIRGDAETGVRAGFKFIQFFDVTEEDAQAVDAYLKSLKPVSSPYLIDGKLSKSAIRGRDVFENNGCRDCHSGPYFTDLEQHDMGPMGKYDKQTIWDTPTLIESWRTAPYLHDGKYSNLQDVFSEGKHGLLEELSDTEIENLTEYLLSL